VTTDPLPRRPSASVVVFGVLAALGLVAAGAALSQRRHRPADLPVLGTVPPFTLVERSQKAMTRDDLRGRPWVAGFVFTRCGGICPAMTARMKDLRAEAPTLDLVSFSVDPEHDTPAVLQSYARQHGIGDRWWLLTGTTAALHSLATDGFRLAAAAVPPEEQQAQLAPGAGRRRGAHPRVLRQRRRRSHGGAPPRPRPAAALTDRRAAA
jgi:protein SCO1/2